MPAFEEVSDTPTPAFVVVGKPTAIDGWQVIPGGLYATEAEATQAAQAAVGDPANWYSTRVCLPTGSLFQDVS